MRLIALAGLSVALGLLSAAALAASPGIEIKPLMRSSLSGDESREVVVASAQFARAATTGRHTHPGDEYATVLEGTLELLVYGQPPKRVRAGETYHNARGVIHETRNVGDGPARLVSTFVIDKGQPIMQPVALETRPPAPADTSGDSPAARLDRIFSLYADQAAPGCAVGVFERGKMVQMRSYGTGDVATGASMTPDTLFYAASVSKQFTALAAALLVEQGKLRLEDDVRKWIPELPDYGTPITVAMLMHHTSGVRDFLGLLDLAGRDAYDQLDIPTALRIITRQRGLNFTPGTQYSYSNGGYFLLAQTVARAAEQPFHEFARQRIFEPLGMKHTFFRNGPNPPRTNAAHGYVADGKGGFELADGYPSVSGSGGLMVSLGDLARYDRDFHVGHKVWSQRVREIMLTPGTLTNGEKVAVNDEGSLYYAGGLNVGMRRGQEWVAHSGGAKGFHNQYVRLPGLKFSVAAFCNRSDASPGPLVNAVIEAFHGEALTGEWPAPALPVEEAIVGRFHSDELDADYTFAREGDGLKVTVSSIYAPEPRTTVLQTVREKEDDVWSLDTGDLRLELAPDRRVSAFTTLDAQTSGIRFVRVR